MATTLTIAGASYGDIAAAVAANANPTAGIYTALKGIGGDPVRYGPDEYEEIPVTFLGVSGIGVIYGDFRGRDIEADLIAVDTSKAGVQGRIDTLINGLNNNGTMPIPRFEVTPPGSTQRLGCKLVRGGMKQSAFFTIGTRWCVLFRLMIRQMSTTN